MSLPRVPGLGGGSLVSLTPVVAVTVRCYFPSTQPWAGNIHARGKRQENHRRGRGHVVGEGRGTLFCPLGGANDRSGGIVTR